MRRDGGMPFHCSDRAGRPLDGNEVNTQRVRIVETPLKFDGRIESPPYGVTLVKLRKAAN